MFTSRAEFAGSSPAASRASRSHAFELLIVNPPPRTPNFPATAGRARTAATADPPLRLRSRPQPQRTAAGRESAYSRAKASIWAAGTRAVWAARAIVLEEPADDREREREIRARLRRDVEVGPFGQPRASRVDDDEPRAPVLRLEDVRHDVDARDGRVDAPEHDQARMAVVLQGDPRHRAVEAGNGGS